MIERKLSFSEASIRPEILYTWQGQALFVTSLRGEISGSGIHGFYFRGARYLKKLQFRINGKEPHFCSHFVQWPNLMEFSMIFPEVLTGGTGGSGSGMIMKQDGIFERDLDIRVLFTVNPSSLECHYTFCNRWENYSGFRAEWFVDADYSTIGEIQSGQFTFSSASTFNSGDKFLVIRNSNPEQPFKTVIEYSGNTLIEVSDGRFYSQIDLGKSDQADVILRIEAQDYIDSVDRDGERQRKQRLHSWINNLCSIKTPGSDYGAIVNNSVMAVGESSLLDGSPDQWLAPAAGYPLYGHMFARDALTSSWMISMFDGAQVAFDTLSMLSDLQGRVNDPFRDEQPGRIIQQARRDPLARVGQNPFGRYYGDFASPFMFIVAFAFAYAWTGDRDKLNTFWPVCKRILDWALFYGDLDNDGYLEYHTLSALGPRNQGWKDSENAIVDDQGALVDPPFATCEAQGYYYAALQAGAFFSLLTGEIKRGISYLKRAMQLKRRFNLDFWVDEGEYIALGLDAKKRQIRSKSSNMGHCLATGIIDSEKVPKVVRALLAPDMFSGWGVRTLSASHPAYNPLDYHLGSIWPVENASIAFGMRRYGFDQEAFRIIKANLDLALQWKEHLVPECVGGYQRSDYAHCGAFPEANVPQTWNAAAFGLFTSVLLGFQPFSPLKILFLDPVLPEWIPVLYLRNLHFCSSVLDLSVFRTRSGKTEYTLIKKKGSAHLVRQQPYNSLFASIWKRLLFAAGISF